MRECDSIADDHACLGGRAGRVNLLVTGEVLCLIFSFSDLL